MQAQDAHTCLFHRHERTTFADIGRYHNRHVHMQAETRRKHVNAGNEGTET